MDAQDRRESPSIITSPDGQRLITLLGSEEGSPTLCRALERADLIGDPRFATPPLRQENSAELIAIIDQLGVKTLWRERCSARTT
jgi:crotonobetainyl-CoA:carnitine CoA-transferase CaiB-like acyl-CoA transferase